MEWRSIYKLNISNWNIKNAKIMEWWYHWSDWSVWSSSSMMKNQWWKSWWKLSIWNSFYILKSKYGFIKSLTKNFWSVSWRSWIIIKSCVRWKHKIKKLVTLSYHDMLAKQRKDIIERYSKLKWMDEILIFIATIWMKWISFNSIMNLFIRSYLTEYQYVIESVFRNHWSLPPQPYLL